MKKLLRPVWELYKFLVLRPIFAVRNTWFVWRLSNRAEIKKQQTSPVPITSEAGKRIIDDLRTDGISITHLDTLFPGSDWLSKLQVYAESLREKSFRNPRKTYWIEMWDVKNFEADMENPFMQFTLDPQIVALSNEYLGLYSKFHSISLSETIPVPPGTPASQSQQWHRDGGDKRYFKVFIYLNDIGEGDGAFEYVRGSQPGGTWEHVFPQINLFATPKETTKSRISDDKVNARIPEEDIITCYGKAGTLVFADTVGIHKGSYSTKGSRLASISSFYSPHPLQRANDWSPSPRFKNQIDATPLHVKYAVE